MMSRVAPNSNIGKASSTQARRLQDIYQRAVGLSSQLRFEYAHELFSHCVTHDSGKLVFAEAMLAILRAKFGDKKKWLFLGGGQRYA
jgi:hypothetical protein